MAGIYSDCSTRGDNNTRPETTFPVADRSSPPFSLGTNLLRWRRGVVVSGVRRMNEVNPRRARLVLGWVTVFGRVRHLGM